MPRSHDDFVRYIKERQVKPPEVLYKYAPMENAWQLLASGHVLWSSPLLYNDPFDTGWDTLWPVRTDECVAKERALFCRALLDPSIWPVDISSGPKRLLEMIRSEIDSKPEESRGEHLEKMLSSLFDERNVPEEAITAQTDLIRRLRVFCLSEEKLSIPMWSHYADHHRGVVLGFDTEAIEMAWKVPIEKVSYVSQMPCLIDVDAWCQKAVFGIGSPYTAEGSEFALAKFDVWQSECEWRFVSVAPPGTPGTKRLYLLPKLSLRSITLGCKADRNRAAELLNLAHRYSRDLTITALDRHPNRFELVEVAQLRW